MRYRLKCVRIVRLARNLICAHIHSNVVFCKVLVRLLECSIRDKFPALELRLKPKFVFLGRSYYADELLTSKGLRGDRNRRVIRSKEVRVGPLAHVEQ